MSRRRLAVGVVAIAAVVLGGRALSIVFDSYSWYESLGARALWNERALDTVLVDATGFIFAALFTLANLAIVGQSVGSLTRPRRLANVEFGEAVPPAQLRLAGIVLSLAVALGLASLLPSWRAVAFAKLGVDFREADPYFQHDLSFYVTWLPLERAVYSWALALIVCVTAIVTGLYIVTSGLRWNAGALRLTAKVRRHLAVLAALLLLVCTWSYRLDAYELLTNGGHDGTGFTFIDHQWMLPALLALSVATVATAITVAISAWMGQMRTSLVAIMAAIALAGLTSEILPFAVERSLTPKEAHRENAPYVATRSDFTRRAFGTDPNEESAENPLATFAAVSAAVPAGPDTLVSPGAIGTLLVDNPTIDIAAPSLGHGFSRLAHAWAARNFSLLSDKLHRRTRIVRVRDVRERVAALYPFFAIGPTLRPLFRGDTLYWSAPLFTSSHSYPLSDRREIWGERVTYFHRTGTALVNARTGRVYAALDIPPEPVAAGWVRKFENAESLKRARDVQRALFVSNSRLGVSGAAMSDTSFRARVIRFYDSMHSALSAGDLRRFGLAYDSLGALVGRVKK
ncbi:MAG: UPF0182 family protein [Gemmatimonadaceae bacterium]|nr:UPF0182 family protein [Gemmatimonadaceae bacterium]